MLSYIAKRLLSAIPTLFIAITLAFFLMRVAPGGPFDLERPLEASVMENLKRVYQLDQPLYVQYGSYLWNLLHGDMGPSFYWRDFSVRELFAKALPISMKLGATALLLALALGSGLSYGCELLQHFVPGRVPAHEDWVMNSVGAAGGCAGAPGNPPSQRSSSTAGVADIEKSMNGRHLPGW